MKHIHFNPSISDQIKNMGHQKFKLYGLQNSLLLCIYYIDNIFAGIHIKHSQMMQKFSLKPTPNASSQLLQRIYDTKMELNR